MMVSGWEVFFLFHFVMTLFGQLGYANGVGIVLGSISLLGNLFQLLSIFLVKEKPGLDMELKIECKLRGDSSAKNVIAQIASWCGCVSSGLVVIVGFTRIFFSEAQLVYCDHLSFIDDNCNAGKFRWNLFTFVPDVFADVWTPLVMGLIGVFFHFKGSKLNFSYFAKDWARFTMYHLTMMLFACIGYNNAWGILVSVFVDIAILFSFIAFIISKKPPPLELNFGCSWQLKGEGANIGGDASAS
eukprot:Selendium_serpulae@DN6300_c0_g1_i5.p1